MKEEHSAQPKDINGYWADRRNHDLYRLTVAITAAMFRDAKSAIDVGCYTSGLLVELDWIERRVATDVQARLAENWADVSDVDFVAGDAFSIDFKERFDLVISNQTVEHVYDPAGFIEKLLNLGRGLIVSTTYDVPAGTVEGHVQDPISLDKFRSWFPCELDAWFVCHHPTARNLKHIVGVVKQSHPARRRRTQAAKVRHPTKSDSFDQLKEMGVPIETVLDVGVQTSTAELIGAFPDKHHVLMEPVIEFEGRMREIYGGAGVSHEVIGVAISDQDGTATLKTSTVFPDQPISHARIVPGHKEGADYRVVPTQTLDTVVRDRQLAKPYLLKVDVDGAELSVLAGATATLDDCSVVVIETPISSLIERCNALHIAGFQPFDIVDLCYYAGRFVAADMLFLNSKTVKDYGLELYRDGFDVRHWVSYRPGP